MRKIVSILLVLILIMSISTLAFAAQSPTIEGIMVPTIIGTKYITNLGHIVTLKFDPIKSITEYAQIPNLLYVFQVSGDYELEEDEYIEISVYVYDSEIQNVKVIMQETENKMGTKQVDENHWAFNLTEYGTVIITFE